MTLGFPGLMCPVACALSEAQSFTVTIHCSTHCSTNSTIRRRTLSLCRNSVRPSVCLSGDARLNRSICCALHDTLMFPVFWGSLSQSKVQAFAPNEGVKQRHPSPVKNSNLTNTPQLGNGMNWYCWVFTNSLEVVYRLLIGTKINDLEWPCVISHNVASSGTNCVKFPYC